MAGKLSEINKPAKAEAPEAEPGKLPTKAAVTKLKTTTHGIDKKMSQLRGEKGAAIKLAASEENVHKGAFAAAMKEFNMDPEARAEYQRHLFRYRRDLGIDLQTDLLKDAAPART